MFGSFIKVGLARLPVVNQLFQMRTMKTHQGIKKRFLVKGSKLFRKKASRNHGNCGFSSRKLQKLDGLFEVTNKGGHLAKLKQALGGGF